MINKIKRYSKTKLAMIVGAISFLVPSMIFAADGTADQSVVTAMTSLADDVVATLQAIAPIAIGIFCVFVVWKFGKKIFNTIAK